MSASENISFWKKKSEIDYIPLFVFLWFSLNAWMRDRFFKEKRDRDRVNLLKRGRVSLFNTFTGLIETPGVDGNRFRAEFGELHRALVDARIPYSQLPDKMISFDCCIIEWKGKQSEPESLIISEEEADESSAVENDSVEADESSAAESDSVLEESEQDRIQIDDNLWVENNTERLFAAYMEIVYQIRCALFHGDLAIISDDPAKKRVVQQLYLTLSMVMRDV